jgi:hypothetical protein
MSRPREIRCRPWLACLLMPLRVRPRRRLASGSGSGRVRVPVLRLPRTRGVQPDSLPEVSALVVTSTI